MVKCAVVGSGLMGCKIAAELARQGHRVKITDKNGESLNMVMKRVEEDKQELIREGLLLQEGYPGQILCLSRLEETVSDAEFIFEAANEALEVKQDLFEQISHCCQQNAVICTNTLNLDINEIVTRCFRPDRCLGLRFLFPIYFIAEVEITPCKVTGSESIDRVRRFMDDMGKTLFFRSGNTPLILTEEQRDDRKKFVLDQIRQTSGLGRMGCSLPTLGHSYNPVLTTRRESASTRSEMECAICLDRQRDCLLAPCHHLSLCCICAHLLQSRKDFCPVCRQPIQDVIKVYHT